MFWLGLVDLAMSSKPDSNQGGRITAFRLSNWSRDLLSGKMPDICIEEDELLTVRADGRIRVPLRVPRAARYQIARFGEWQGYKDEFYRYRLTPTALQDWDTIGSQASMMDVCVLRVRDPKILNQLRNSSTARYLEDLLGPTTVVIRPGAKEKVMMALAEMGYLTEVMQEETQ
jgi:hypothetical protein